MQSIILGTLKLVHIHTKWSLSSNKLEGGEERQMTETKDV